MLRHLQRTTDSIDYKPRLFKRRDLEQATLQSKKSVKETLTLDDEPS